MDIFFWILISTFFVSLLGFAGVFSLWMRDKELKKATHILTAFAIGSLLGGAFFHLLPEAAEGLAPQSLFLFALIGFILFFLIESYFHWHSCDECDIHPYSYLMVVGDAVHNFIDGLVLSVSYLVSIPFGIVTTIVIFAHEFPQELGIFGVLIHGGLNKRNALVYSYIAQFTVIIGGVTGYFLSSFVQATTPFLLAFAAGGFLYIAASDLIPDMHKVGGREKIVSLVITFLGLIFMWLLKVFGAP